MKTKYVYALLVLLLECMMLETAAAKGTGTVEYDRSQGYYKDVFMDSGIALTSRRDLPVCRSLNLSMEKFVSSSTSKKAMDRAKLVDTLLQRMIMVGNPLDENGVLLYPDGSPRFRLLYVNGGASTSHGRSFGKAGLESLRQFVRAGGSYVGTCAGAYFASAQVFRNDSVMDRKYYLGIWPGCVIGTRVKKSRPTIAVGKRSPLLDYGLTSDQIQVDSVFHNLGCYADVEHNWPDGTEILARFSVPATGPRHDLDGKPVIWAYKASETSGRVVPCGSHPESITDGARLDLMSAMVRYAIAGNGTPKIKSTLVSGEQWMMDRNTRDKDPLHTRIGDRQYHHFAVDVPKGARMIIVELENVKGYTDYDLFLYASSQSLAFADVAQYRNVASGVSKKMVIENPKDGRHYISVFCNTTVDAVETKYGTMYTGRIDVLNGVPYSIKATVVK